MAGGLEIKCPPTLLEVRVHRSAPGKRAGITAVFVLLHAICLQWCIRTSGQPYEIALEKLKESNRKHHLNQTKDEDKPPEDPLPWDKAPNEWAGAALFFSISFHVLFHFVCHWRVHFRAAALFKPAARVSEGCWFELFPHSHRGHAALVPVWRAAVSGRLCIEFQRQRYEYWGADAYDSDDEFTGSASAEPETGELRMMECPTEEPLETYFSKPGLGEEQVEELKAKFGQNLLKVPTPSFFQCYREQLASPLVVFQVFIALLWAADDFLGYTVVQIFIILMFESTSVFQRIHMLKTLNSMGTKPYDIKVYRDSAWVTVSTADLLPGDLMQINLEKPEKDAVEEAGGNSGASNATPAKDKDEVAMDIVPVDCVILSGTAVANEATLTGESVPQMKDALPQEDRQLDFQGADRCHSLFSGSRLLRAVAVEKTSGDEEKAAADNGKAVALPHCPDGGCLCRALRTGFYSSQGELLQVIEFSRMKVAGDSKEIMVALLLLLCCALIAAGWVLKKGLEAGDRTPHELIIKCVIILTSVVPRGLPMQMSLVVNTSLMSLIKAGVYCTEPFRVPMAGKITHCMFDKTGTLTTDTLVPAGIVNGCGSCRDEPWRTVEVRNAASEAALVLAACHSLVAEGDGKQAKLTGDPIEVAAIKGVGWSYDPATSVTSPGDSSELELQVESLRIEVEKLKSSEEAAYSSAERMNIEQQRTQRESSMAAAEKAIAAEKERAEQVPISSAKIIHRFHFASKLQRMCTVADIETRENSSSLESGRYALVKGSPEALRPLLAESSVPSWFETSYLEMAERGRRVLALALRRLASCKEGEGEEDVTKLTREDVERELEFVGFIAFECQLRSDTKLVITALKDSGHKVVMVTGDAPLTALHVARECDIAKEAPTLQLRADAEGKPTWVVAAGELRGQPAPSEGIAALAESYNLAATEEALEAIAVDHPEFWEEAVYNICIFARMTPNGKAKVIRAVQQRGHFVLMCGDGGNDAGALKQADAGLALLAGHGNVNTADISAEKPANGDSAKNSSAIVKHGEAKDAEDMLNARQKEIQQRTKDLQKLRSSHLKAKQREYQQLQQKWLEEELQKRSDAGQTGLLAQGAAVKVTLGRFTNELRREMKEFDLKHGNVFDSTPGADASKADPAAALEASMPKGMSLAQPGEASVAAPFTSRTPSVRGCVDLIRLGRSTLLSALQQQQVMMMNAIINAFVLSAISREGSRSSERQMIASEWLITTASLSFSYASPCDRMHRVRPLRSLFHPAIFLSMIGQAAIHLGCLYFAVTMARAAMDEDSPERAAGFEGPSLKDVREFWRRQKLIRRGVIAKEEEEKDWYEQVLEMWLYPFLPNLMNTVVFLVETAQTVAVLMVNYKGQPWMKGLLENRPLFFAVFVIIGGVAAAAWELSPEANGLLHLSPFPSDEFRWKVMGLVFMTIIGTFAWDRLCTAIFASENFRATLESASRTTFRNDIWPLIQCAIKVALGFAALGMFSGMSSLGLQQRVVAIPA